MATLFGPWLGVAVENQRLCAVEGCTEGGVPQVCPYDGRYHHHGCIHYDAAKPGHGLVFRNGWGLVCPAHYEALCKHAGIAIAH